MANAALAPHFRMKKRSFVYPIVARDYGINYENDESHFVRTYEDAEPEDPAVSPKAERAYATDDENDDHGYAWRHEDTEPAANMEFGKHIAMGEDPAESSENVRDDLRNYEKDEYDHERIHRERTHMALDEHILNSKYPGAVKDDVRNDETDNDEIDNYETVNFETDNDETNNDETDNDETDKDETNNDETDSDETDNDDERAYENAEPATHILSERQIAMNEDAAVHHRTGEDYMRKYTRDEYAYEMMFVDDEESATEKVIIDIRCSKDNKSELVPVKVSLKAKVEEILESLKQMGYSECARVLLTTVPTHPTSMPHNTTAPSPQTTSMPHNTTAAPTQLTSKSDNATAAPTQLTSKSDNATAVPPSLVSKSNNATTMPPLLTSKSPNATTIPPRRNITISQNATTVPPTSKSNNATTKPPPPKPKPPVPAPVVIPQMTRDHFDVESEDM